MRFFDHVKYPSIENHTNKKYVDSILQMHTGSCEEWVCTEKIHGANIQIHTNGNQVKFGSRNKMLDLEGDNFYGLTVDHPLYKQISNGVVKIFDNISMAAPGKHKIVVFGELYGGTYPHPEVKKTEDKAVQKGVFYSPTLEFRIFDILMFYNSMDGEKATWYELYDYNQDNCVQNSGLFKVPVIAAPGKLDLILSHSFESHTTELSGCPPIENNFIEGVVIRPSINLYDKYGHRILIKKKNENFQERKEAPRKLKVQHEKVHLPTDIRDAILENVTKQRLDNIASHDGIEIDIKNIGKLLKPLAEDIDKELSLLSELTKEELNIAHKLINSIAVKLIKEYV